MKILMAIIIFGVFSCQHKVIQSTDIKKAEGQTSEVKKSELPATDVATEPTATATGSSQQILLRKAAPHFGVIFSGGGARAWAHIGVLKEMQKYKFPIASIVGIEWGAVVGAIYAQNLSSNEVEWEMSKFKSIEKSNDFLQSVFAKKEVVGMKSSFACPSINLKSQAVYILNRGHLDQFMPFCLPSPGLVKPYGQSVALMTDVTLLVQYLKSTGVQKVILINTLSSKNSKAYINSIDSIENQVWVASAAQLVKKNIGIDDVVDINVSDIAIEDFDRRHEMMAKGSEQSYAQIKKLAEKYGL
jgi:hypothetical protein